MTDIVIVAAARTPVGSFNGSLAGLSGAALGEIAIREVLKRAKVDAAEVSEVILGQVLTAAQGMNAARQASIGAGLPKEVPAWGVNQVCGSGLRAIALGGQAIKSGDSAIVVAGGQESMSNATHAMYLRSGTKMGNVEMIDTMIRDGLWDAFNGYHMGDDRRERGAPVADHARRPGRVRRRLAAEGRGRAQVGPLQGRDRAGQDHGEEGREAVRHRRVSRAPAPPRRRWPS